MEAETNLGRIGRCIYCGSTENLTDEHVIPKALGGLAQLFDASCTACNAKTSAFERLVLRDQLGPFRARLGLPSRRGKNRPSALPARVRIGDDWKEIDIPIGQYPVVGVWPRFPPPGAAVGRAPGEAIPMRWVGVWLVPRDGLGMDAARRAGVDEIKQTTSVATGSFMQMLAKIAWGFSVSLLGLDRIEPAILGVILGTDPDPARWVGCPPPGSSGFEGAEASGLQVRVCEVGPFVLAFIRLFPERGTPEYMVVVGRTKPPPQPREEDRA